MSARRLGVLAACTVGVVLMIGVVQAGAQGSPMVLKFYDAAGTFTGVGFNPNSNTPPPLGASVVITLHLKNVGSQFGKSSGATVGRVLLDCTYLSVNPPNGDGVCDGIAHVPDGYFTFGGNGVFLDTKVDYYAITGGVGPFANDRGQIKVVNGANGGSTSTVTLTSP